MGAYRDGQPTELRFGTVFTTSQRESVHTRKHRRYRQLASLLGTIVAHYGLAGFGRSYEINNSLRNNRSPIPPHFILPQCIRLWTKCQRIRIFSYQEFDWGHIRPASKLRQARSLGGSRETGCVEQGNRQSVGKPCSATCRLVCTSTSDVLNCPQGHRSLPFQAFHP